MITLACVVEGCERTAEKLCWCSMHYHRWKEHGSAYWRPPTLEERFWAKVKLNHARGCWEWQASKDNTGYGHFFLDHDTLRVAHRVAYEILVGPIPEDLQLDHRCRNRSCVNPGHLEPVTGRENKLRGDTVNARNLAKTHCRLGHPYDEENTLRTPSGARRCRTCARRWSQESQERRKARRRLQRQEDQGG